MSEMMLGDPIEFMSNVWEPGHRPPQNWQIARYAPPLREMSKGFWGRKGGGSYANPGYRKKVGRLDGIGRPWPTGGGEWASDYVRIDTGRRNYLEDGYIYADWITGAEFEEKHGKVVLARCRVMPTALPPPGWWVPKLKDGRLMYDDSTGAPLATLPYDEKAQAQEMLDEAGFDPRDLSFFDRGSSGLYAVSRINDLGGPFHLRMTEGAHASLPHVGIRGLPDDVRERLGNPRSWIIGRG